MNEYITPHALKDYVGIRDEDRRVREYVPGEDGLILAFCTRASRLIDRFTFRKFYPHTETRYFDLKYSDHVCLDDDLLEVSTFTTANTNTTVGSSYYFLIPYTEYPKHRIDLDLSTGTTLSFSGTPQQANAITATWGYHTDWDNAWVDSGDDLAAQVSSTTATTITVDDAEGQDVYGRAPRFQHTQLLKIDSEYLYIYGKQGNTTLQVIRGVNGTTAATHDAASTIYVYEPDADVIEILAEWGKYLYRHKDAQAAETTAFPELGMVVSPSGLPAGIRENIERLKRRQIK